MKNKSLIILCGLLASLFIGCEDLKFGDNFLEKPNSDDVSIDTVFSSKKYADQALNQFYKSLWDFMPTLRGCHPEGLILDGYTDIGYAQPISWTRGDFNSSSSCINFPYFPFHSQITEVTGNPSFGIRKAYIYIENVDKVPDMTDDEKRIRKAEAKVVIAFHYTQMIRFYGGMPWIDHAYAADEIFQFPRLTLEETVNKTVALLDEAATDLPWSTTAEEYGHMTAAAAKALKFRLLLFVASPLFNNKAPYYDGQAATELLTWYGNQQDSRWEAALEAGREFLRLNMQNGDYYRIENTGNPREDYVNGYFTKGNQEVGSGSTLSYIEISDKGSEENPVQIVFDLGENPHEYNSIGLIPRLQWVGNSPKYLKIEVSDEVLTRSEDITNWILVGSAKRDAFTKTELDAHDGGNWNDWYADKQFVKWHDLGENMHHRYIRLSMWDSWYSTHCFDEIFVSKK